MRASEKWGQSFATDLSNCDACAVVNFLRAAAAHDDGVTARWRTGFEFP